MTAAVPPRDELALRYLDALCVDPYPVQSDALEAWFESEQGLLLCTPTGTGKTLVAEAALFEGLVTGRRVYYTTPLIALCEQKFRDLRHAAVRWGFSADQVGLVTGNRQVNPEAPLLVVVAEVLLNRLLQQEHFDFSGVAAVVMDEFHSFNDPDRGVVWELSLGLLPETCRLLLLSATVGNASEFLGWLRTSHDRRLRLIQSTERRVPLTHHWIGDRLLPELVEEMAAAEEPHKKTPALIFCFHREGCWSTAEQLKGRRLIDEKQKRELAREVKRFDWDRGGGRKLKPLLLRGVGVHHAGLLPRYKRIVEDLFVRRLLTVVVCTETLAAGINLPARSVVLTELIKGPPGKKRLLAATAAHQMFGRAGRPQFDDRGNVYALAHEDDVRILKFQERLDAIPEQTGDPGLIQARKKLKKKMPSRSPRKQYWNQKQFERVIATPPAGLASRGSLPWRLLAHLLSHSPEVDRLREFVSRRLLNASRLKVALRELDAMLLTLWAGGFVTLDPPPPNRSDPEGESPETTSRGGLGALLIEAAGGQWRGDQEAVEKKMGPSEYQPRRAVATEKLDVLLKFRSIDPLYGSFLMDHLGLADSLERIQALESVLELPGAFASLVRVPGPERVPQGPLALQWLHPELLQRGLATAEELAPEPEPDAFGRRRWPLPLAEKLKQLFLTEFPRTGRLRINAVWAVGAVLEFGGDFGKVVDSLGLARQEGVLFRHLLRFLLLLQELEEMPPRDSDPQEWSQQLIEWRRRLTETCREVDLQSTDQFFEDSMDGDPLMADGAGGAW